MAGFFVVSVFSYFLFVCLFALLFGFVSVFVFCFCFALICFVFRGDVVSDIILTSLNQTRYLKEVTCCHFDKAIGWSDTSDMLHETNERFNSPVYFMWCTEICPRLGGRLIHCFPPYIIVLSCIYVSKFIRFNNMLLYINNRIGQQVIPTYMRSSPYKLYTWINDSKTKHRQSNLLRIKAGFTFLYRHVKDL